jgi:hypothetical protein
MAIAINWAAKVITVPQADLAYVSPGLYSLDVNAFRLSLKDLEDDEVGMTFASTHNHNTEVTLSGVTYARVVEIINGYTITFQDTGTPYTVKCIGANHNIGDVKNVNQVSLIIGNSAGLITVATGGVAGPTAGDIAVAVWQRALESGITAEQMLRIMLAALAGTSQDTGTSIERYFGIDKTTARLTATFDKLGNRSSVVIDGA